VSVSLIAALDAARGIGRGNQMPWHLPDDLRRFKALTGCPILVNTSFNVRGEPIVCTPADAYRCFMGTDIDDLVVGNAILSKENQPPALRHQHHLRFAAD